MADQTQTLVAAGFITALWGVGILGARYIILEALAKAYCACSHEFNQHYVVPYWMVNPEGSEKCKLCGCKAYNKNPKDERNTK
jgi:hypothetical protein